MAAIRSWMALVLAAATLFIATWIVVPAPTRFLLNFGVGAPEVSHWIVLASLGAMALAWVPARRAGRSTCATSVTRNTHVARIALAAAALSFALGTLPLLQFPFAARRLEHGMKAALGEDYLQDIPLGIRATMRQSPLVTLDLFRGIPRGNVQNDPRVTRDIPFATPRAAGPEGAQLTLDVYRPAIDDPASDVSISGTPHPIVVQIYGGSWQRGRPRSNADFARYLAARGYVVFAIDYRHAPAWRWPAQLTDVNTALTWISAHAAEYNGDPARIALVGRSAGAHLALMAAYQPGALPVRAVVNFYGPVDLAAAYAHPPRPDPLRIRPIEETLLGGTPATMPDRYREASPVDYATRPLPPTLNIYGGRDHAVEPRFGRLLDSRLRATGTQSILLEIPWAEHAFDAVWNGPSSQLALYHAERFLAWGLCRVPQDGQHPSK